MSGWSFEDAMAMERRHIIEGEERVARQDVLTGQLIEKGYWRIAHDAAELLKLMYASVELSRDRLRYLEDHYGQLSN
jgi:hypothetical protein